MNNNEQTNEKQKIKPDKVTIRISETIGEKVAKAILFKELDLATPMPPISDIDQIDLLLTIDHSDKGGGQSDES